MNKSEDEQKIKIVKNREKKIMQKTLNIIVNTQKQSRMNFINRIFIINERVNFCDMFL